MNLSMISTLRLIKDRIDNGSDGICYNDYMDLISEGNPTNFDVRIVKDTAMEILQNDILPNGWDIMCKEYGEEEEWVGMCKEDSDDPSTHWETFEVWVNE